MKKQTTKFVLLAAAFACFIMSSLQAQDLIIQKTDGSIITIPLNMIDSITFFEGGGPFECGTSTVTDADGNIYNTLPIGEQCWTKENLKVGAMIDGSQNQTENSIIEKYCVDNDPAKCDLYGGLYQWEEMMQYSTTPGIQGICMNGWHIPTHEEWTTLSDYLNGEDVAGGKMKTTGTIEEGTGLWYSPNTGATNSSGFTGLPGGWKFPLAGPFEYLSSFGYWWTSSRDVYGDPWFSQLKFNSANLYQGYIVWAFGFSVRCLRNETTTSQLEVTPSNRDITAEAGTTTFYLTSNTIWTVEENINWLTISPMSGTNNEVLTVTYEANPSGNPRNGQIAITANGGSPVVYVTVNQATSSPSGCGQPFTDTRNGQSFETVQIGNQCWMKENLKVGNMIDGSQDQTDNGIIEKYCYENDPANCDVYGGLYQWNEMMQYSTTPGVQGICMSGWHLPTHEEWSILSTYLGGESVAGGKMKATGTIEEGNGLWYYPNTGATNETGFSGLPAGSYASGSFYYQGSYSNFWAATLYSSGNAWDVYLSYSNSYLFQGSPDQSLGFSVRCLRNVNVADELYLLGDATSIGWNNTAALPMTGNDGVFTITTNLEGGGTYLKFIVTLGQWTPQYGTDGNGTSTGGNLVYRPDEITPDPYAIPAPSVSGTYIVTANTNNLTYTIVPAKK